MSDIPFYDVMLSYANEDQAFVESVAIYLKENGTTVFYDGFEETRLWGENLPVFLDNVCRKKSRCVVLFVSASYNMKVWTNFEFQSAISTALTKKGTKFLLPARFDATDLPGLNPDIKYIDLRNETPESFADKVLSVLNELPPAPEMINATSVDLDTLLDEFREKKPFLTADECLRALNLNNWPHIDLSFFKSTPSPQKISDIKILSSETELVFNIKLCCYLENHYKFQLNCTPNNDKRREYYDKATSSSYWQVLSFGQKKTQEKALGSHDKLSCNQCGGTGILSQKCNVCDGQFKVTIADKLFNCPACNEGKKVAVCNRCKSAGYLDVFYYVGRHAFPIECEILKPEPSRVKIPKSSTLESSLIFTSDVSSTPLVTMPINSIKLSKNGTNLNYLYKQAVEEIKRHIAEVETGKQRPPEQIVVSEEPFVEKLNTSTFRTYINGYRLQVTVTRLYALKYERNISYETGILIFKESKSNRLSGELLFMEGEGLKLISHSEKLIS